MQRVAYIDRRLRYKRDYPSARIDLAMKFDFDSDKNSLLYDTRNVRFIQIIEAIANR